MPIYFYKKMLRSKINCDLKSRDNKVVVLKFMRYPATVQPIFYH